MFGNVIWDHLKIGMSDNIFFYFFFHVLRGNFVENNLQKTLFTR